MMRFGENMELYNEYELISHSKLADCSMFIVDMVYRPMHLHKEMELCYILSGTCRVSTDRQSFTAGAAAFCSLTRVRAMRSGPWARPRGS